MKFVSYNIQYSRGKDGNFELERIADAVRGADVIAMQEVTRGLPGMPHADQPARIGELLPDYYWIYGPAADMDASEKDAEGRVTNRRRQFGNMLLARWPILSSRLLLLPRTRTYDKSNLQRGALEGVVDLPGGALRIYSVHLDHLNGEERLAQVKHLLPRLFNARREGGAVTGAEWREIKEVPMSEEFVLMGDFNMTPQSPEYERVVGQADYYYGTRISAEHLIDTWVHTGHSLDGDITWYDESEDFRSGLRLDYGFVSAGLAASVKSAWIDSDAPGSDHQPIWFELEI